MLVRFAPLLLLLAPIGALAGALVAQFGFGMEPCHLCTLQRLPFAAAIIFAVLALIERRDRHWRGFLLGFVALIFAVNGGIAFFHVGVEAHWWESACAEAQPLSDNASGLLAKLAGGPAPPACDMVPFALFGVLSFAGMNLIASPLCALFAAWAAGRTWRQA
jgi:disulfide bond formation protein DsbB